LYKKILEIGKAAAEGTERLLHENEIESDFFLQEITKDGVLVPYR
jgi:hypothetical protein